MEREEEEEEEEEEDDDDDEDCSPPPVIMRGTGGWGSEPNGEARRRCDEGCEYDDGVCRVDGGISGASNSGGSPTNLK